MSGNREGRRPVSGPAESRHLADETATLDFGRGLAERLRPGQLIFLEGQLGAGKTTLVRGILRAFGHTGAVKSPTYTLLEPYEIGDLLIYHFDLYRIGDSEELDYIGIDELMDSNAIKLVEWPERGAERLPQADMIIRLAPEGKGRRVELFVSP